MTMPIEIPITMIEIGEESIIQIAPDSRHDGLPAGRTLHPISGLPNINDRISELDKMLKLWEGQSTPNPATQRNVYIRLKEVGKRVVALLPGENITSLCKLQSPENGSSMWRRILVYTDSGSSTIPIEAMWSDESFGGNPIKFVAANPGIPLSIVRHLGLEPVAPMVIEKGQPMRMLVVFSNPCDQRLCLGSITAHDSVLKFDNQLHNEQQALNDQLGDLVRLGQLQLHFLIGKESDQDNSVVYKGQVRARPGQQLFWSIEQEHNRDLQSLFLQLLGTESWHILHYFGHGEGNTNPELVLRPGHNLSSVKLGEQISKMPRIVILNACDSATPVDQHAPVPTGFATIFLLHETVNLICMQTKVTPKTATLITREVYSRLSRSLFTRQMDFEEALYEVRKRIHDDQDPRLDFFCPVLYSRPVNGSIFNYNDERLKIWELIRGEKLSLNPMKLLKVIRWCSILDESK